MISFISSSSLHFVLFGVSFFKYLSKYIFFYIILSFYWYIIYIILNMYEKDVVLTEALNYHVS